MGAFASHRPTPRRRTYWRPAIAVAVVAAVAGILASPPGRSVIHAIREAVGVKNAQHELFSLPAPGRLLVQSARGPWVVETDGSRRLLGFYREASWSPFGRFVVARRGDELVTMEPDGKVHWTLARPGLRLPAWGGRHEDTRIAYLARGGLHVVAGDGTGDAFRCADDLAPVVPAWQPGSLSILAFAAADGRVYVYDTTTCRRILRTLPGPRPTRLEWSSDARLLLVAGPEGVRVYDARGRLVRENVGPTDDATFVGGGNEAARLGANGDVRVGDRVVFHAAGLHQLLSSPDGRWLLLTWPAADQWVFVRVEAPHTIRAVSGLTRQFGGGGFPAVSGWIGK
jgi:hypothetical protein